MLLFVAPDGLYSLLGFGVPAAAVAGTIAVAVVVVVIVFSSFFLFLFFLCKLFG